MGIDWAGWNFIPWRLRCDLVEASKTSIIDPLLILLSDELIVSGNSPV